MLVDNEINSKGVTGTPPSLASLFYSFSNVADGLQIG